MIKSVSISDVWHTFKWEIFVSIFMYASGVNFKLDHVLILSLLGGGKNLSFDIFDYIDMLKNEFNIVSVI